MKALKSWTASLLLPAGVLLSVWTWRIHYLLGLVTVLLCWHFLIARPYKAVADALSASTYREWALSTRFLSVLGWANTLGEASESGLPPLPVVTRDFRNRNDRWWYHPEGVSNGEGGTIRDGDTKAIVDFSKMTMTITTSVATFTYELQPKDDADEPYVENRLISRLSKDGSVEFVESQEWEPGGPNGLDIAYQLFARTKRQRAA